MFEFEKEELSQSITKYKILEGGNFLSFEHWIKYLKESPEFIMFYINLLKTSPYKAFFWEVKPMDEKSKDDDFEFVLVESTALQNIVANSASFQKYFKSGEEVIAFPNLGGDAQLIVPTPLSNASNYNHLATFVRAAPFIQIVSFWKRVGDEYEKLIGKDTKWLSTAGLGVYWLHVRIDSRPKYYRFAGYKSIG